MAVFEDEQVSVHIADHQLTVPVDVIVHVTQTQGEGPHTAATELVLYPLQTTKTIVVQNKPGTA